MSFSAPSPPDSSSSFSSHRNSAQTSPQAPSTELGVDPSDPFNLLIQHSSHNSDTSMDDSSAGDSPPDWSQLSSFWPTSTTFDSTFGADGNEKQFTDMDFNMSLSPDFDFVSSMTIDPNALQFDNQRINFNPQDFAPSNLLAPDQSFPFTFKPRSPVTPAAIPQQRRLSVTSSSSSSGASLSPIVESRSPSVHAQEQTNINADDAAEELAQRVRQSAGVMWAVPMNSNMQHPQVPMPNPQTSDYSPQLSTPISATGPIPIPASSPNAFLSSSSSVSSAASTPPPSTPPPHLSTSTENLQSIDQLSVPAPTSTAIGGGSSMTVLPRPKTSHTTIERRYRTNLNARIMSLRMAVPALRVLEDRDGTGVGGGGKKTKGKNATLGRNVVFGTKIRKEGEDGQEVVDAIDDRGFVDGVKVARKCSKANVLGKAVEYIKVLKKRELRLKREQEGLKSLISGLVGGPALLREWEREWREKFGGEEKDEVEGDDIQDDDDDDEGGSADEDDDEDGARKRKRPKVAPTIVKKEPKERKPPTQTQIQTQPQPQVMPDGSVVVPEKRKRGRPRKNPIPSAPNSIPAAVPPPVQAVDQPMSMYVQPQPPVQQQQGAQPAQYLLATFALFSFFNNPFSSTSSSAHPPPNHTHSGVVVSHHTHAGVGATTYEQWIWQWTMHDFIQAFHFFVSILVFFSIVLPWLPLPSKYFSLSYLSSSLRVVQARGSSSTASTSNSSGVTPPTRPTKPRSRSASLLSALSISKRGSPEEIALLKRALNTSISAPLKGLFGKTNKENVGFEKKGLEQRAWIRVGEIIVLGLCERSSTLDRALTWWHMRSHLSWFTASAADLSTLALVAWPLGRFARQHARNIWEAARARKTPFGQGERDGGVNVQVRAHERLVLESMNVDEAVEQLKMTSSSFKGKKEELVRYSPIGVLAWMLVRTRVKRHLEVMFVKAVLPREPLELGDEMEDSTSPRPSVCEDEREDDERRRTIEAARSLGGKMAELGDVLQKVGTMGVWELDDLALFSDEEEEDLDTEIKVLLNALILYRQIFSSSILDSSSGYGNGCGNGAGVSILLSPPPSPGSKDFKLQYELRRVLGSSVFDSEKGPIGEALEDARDKVVDMLVENERASRC
ncbi:hypothetical protein K435DRAFT_734288 [Dendrothele bispora CBS 962.96]|uniref:BHLH domain-containing protein n=1 Tax=Dendrothele bispora (strain CBS 962.96) TaxID=1314807 RepID=A0A4S8L456_DENBC|nr:hypothetical protein K435DRAFT_734288 [Dendrothele bispora CBS 962.96]